MEILGTPNEEFMKKISSESVSSLLSLHALNFYQLIFFTWYKFLYIFEILFFIDKRVKEKLLTQISRFLTKLFFCLFN